MESQLLPALVAPWSSCSWACQMLEVPYPPPWGFLPKVQPQQYCFNHGLSSTSTFITHFKEREAAKIIISSALAFPEWAVSVSVLIKHHWGPLASQLRWSMTYLILSLPKPSRAAPHMAKSPTRCTFNSTNISVSMKSKRWNHHQCDSENQTTGFWECS